jgi:hypothetical protein
MPERTPAPPRLVGRPRSDKTGAAPARGDAVSAGARLAMALVAETALTHLDRNPGPRGSCSLGEFVRSGKAWVAESVCREGKSTLTGWAVATGDFETEYRIDTVVTQTAPARREDREAVVTRWLGHCETGQRPGDLVVPGMGTLNMDDGTFRAASPTRAARTPPAGQSTARPAGPSATVPPAVQR